MRRRIIFLDIDGVLNTMRFMREANNPFVMNPASVALLRRVVEATGALIVISSSWRHGADWEERIHIVFANAGWDNPPIIGRTPEPDINCGRGREIATWLESNPANDFVIVDDEVFDMLPEHRNHIVRCDGNLGFCDTHASDIENRWAN